MDVFSRISQAVSGSPAKTQNNDETRNTPKPSEKRQGSAAKPVRKPLTVKQGNDEIAVFKDNWREIQASLLSPNQAALHHGIARTDLVARLQNLSDALVSEANRSNEDNEITGPCMEALLEGDLLSRLVKLTANDRIAGSQAEVIRLFASLVILLDENFLSRQAVHRPLVRLMRICVGEEFLGSTSTLLEVENEDEESKAWRRFGRDGSAETLGFEEDLVDMMCHVASRLRNSPELLIIFFRDRGGDAEAKRAFNKAFTGNTSPYSKSGSRNSTRPTSPSGSSNSAANIKTAMPAVSSPLRPLESLPISPRGDVHLPSNTALSSSTALTYDFPLFSYLCRFVHRESRTGELARAGLLFLVDVAFAPDRRNLGRLQRKEEKLASGRVQSARAPRDGPIRKGMLNSSARVRLDIDYGLWPSLALAKCMLESDFAEVLGASLGAVYGLLPSKIAVSRQSATREREESSGMSLGGSVLPNIEAESFHQRGIELNTSDEVREQARLLCDLLEFTQDILRTTSRMPSEVTIAENKTHESHELLRVSQSLTKSIGSSIQKQYLENILYPTLLECSDADGSAVAVMTYLDLMLGILEDDGTLAEYVIGWLVGQELSSDASEASTERTRKHKSTAMLKLERERGTGKEKSAYFSDAMGRYTIKDLILAFVKTSVKPEAVIAALNLTSTIMTYHGRFSLGYILQVVADDNTTAFPNNSLRSILTSANRGTESSDDGSEEFIYSVSSKEDELFEATLLNKMKKSVGTSSVAQHTRMMNLYLSLASQIGGGTLALDPGKEVKADQEVYTSSTGFDNYLEEAEQGLIRDSMYWDGLCTLGDGSFDEFEAQGNQVCYKHKMTPHDPVLRTMLELLSNFWQNSPEVNIALTGSIAALILCPMRGLEGFVTFERDSTLLFADDEDNEASVDDDDDDDDDDRSVDEKQFDLIVKRGQTKEKYGHSKVPKKLNTPSHSTIASPPILLNIIRSLVLVLGNYRTEVVDFNRMLRERRKGLLFVENLSEALQVPSGAMSEESEEKGGGKDHGASTRYEPNEALAKELWRGVEMNGEVVQERVPHKSPSRARHISLPPSPFAVVSQERMKAEADEAAPKSRREGGFTRFFGRSKEANTAAKLTPATGTEFAASAKPQPFAQHYQETSSLYLEINRIRLSSKSKWSSHYEAEEEKKKSLPGKRTRFKDVDGDSGEDDVNYPGAGEGDHKASLESTDAGRRGLVNLSSLLDNAVILEEFLKELAAILQIRRANGVDAIQFV
ncbi:hypothetical protein CBS101457_000492 [Exobasidium rhododendri]|nr:hypothetical protein CBS101457_000492 [Exobasidium rhododendri]